MLLPAHSSAHILPGVPTTLEPRLILDSVRFGFPTRPDFLGPISLRIDAGQCWGVIGPNGAGKSTLLRLMAGLYRPTAGRVLINGRDLSLVPIRRRAQHIAFLPQHPPCDLDATAGCVVLLGRFPHRRLSLFESPDDRCIARQTMEWTGTLPFADRPMATLSGGEAQRVHLAAALAQSPELLLLDEPTASLDIAHQLAILSILRDRAEQDGVAVIVVTHDVNLAAQFCSHILLLSEGQLVAGGPPDEVVAPAMLASVYGVPMTSLVAAGDASRRWVVPVDGTGGNGQ